MKFKKQKLAQAEHGYFITHFSLLGQHRILAAPEGPGPAMAFAAPEYESKVIATEPGGCMGFAPVPGHEDAFLMITKFYPIFQSEGAGIDLFQAVDGLNQPWQGKRILDLPFVHRITMVGNGTDHFLVAAAVCGGKDFQDDWSKPGKTYVAKVPNDINGPWELTPVMEGLHRNHGMQTGTFNGHDCVYITSDEGLFALEIPTAGSSDWKCTLLVNEPISEVYAADLDNDGQDEVAVIEPFHGNAVSVYKHIGGTWKKIFTAELAFGHGLWAGQLGGENVVIAGNRANDKNLACFRVTSTDPFAMEESVVDPGSATTNMDVINTPTGPALVTSNQGHEEYAIYWPEKN